MQTRGILIQDIRGAFAYSSTSTSPIITLGKVDDSMPRGSQRCTELLACTFQKTNGLLRATVSVAKSRGWNSVEWIAGTLLPCFLYSANANRADELMISRSASSWASPDISEHCLENREVLAQSTSGGIIAASRQKFKPVLRESVVLPNYTMKLPEPEPPCILSSRL